MNKDNVDIDNAIWYGWMDWNQIAPFADQIIDWEQEVIIKHHYPDKSIPRAYSEERVYKLKEYLETGETFFWGVMKNGELLGYYWAIISEFLYERTWNERSCYISEKARGLGFGLLAKQMALLQAAKCNCKISKSMYAPSNKAQAHIYKKLGFHESRIEVTKEI